MACRSCDLDLISELEGLLASETLSRKQRTAARLMIWVFKVRKACRPSTVKFKFYGNWCGPNHSGPEDPIDAVDCACHTHDKCYKARLGL